MPLFLSDEDFRQFSDDASLVAEKADLFIRELYNQLETVKAEADAASITAEQTCSLLEQKYVSLTAEFSTLQSQHLQVNGSLDQRASELEQIQSEKQQLVLQSIEKDGEIERLTREAAEHHKSKRQLMEMLQAKDLEISEKNATIKSYLDKIVNLTETAASREARQADLQSELTLSQASSARLLQEKELLERHNTWLNEELTAKVDSLIELRKTHGELEADMSAKLADVKKKYNQSCSSLKLNKERVKELEAKVASLEEEFLSSKDAAAAAEEHFSAEISTVTKLVELYKETSEEWFRKAGELEGVIKALETNLNQVENDYKEKLEKEISLRKEAEKEVVSMKEKLQTCDADLEICRKENELKLLPLSSFTTDTWTHAVECNDLVEVDRRIVPRIPAGISGNALAASLLRDGWSLAKIYAKYQEAVDALQHEQLGRKQTQATLERVLYEIEEKAGLIMDERAEHERLVEAYSVLDQKLQHSHSALETTIQELKAGLKRQERDCFIAQNEIVNLQKQVAVLLKECRDVQLRCGSVGRDNGDGAITSSPALRNVEFNAEIILSERLLTFKDINGLVEQNVQLRSLARGLSDQIEEKEIELKEKYEKELQKHTEETAAKVNAVLMRAEEQGRMIESLHSSVAMYKKLYEEEYKRRSSYPQPQEEATEVGDKEAMILRETVNEASKKVQEKALERVKNLEEDIAKLRSDIILLRSERDKLGLEAQFAQEKLARFMKEFEHQRDEHNGVIARNVEFSRLIIDHQRKLRESSESLNASEELSRKLTMEISVLKNEKEILLNSEKRASDEVRSLSERVYRLQASLGTIQSTQEVHEEARSLERRKQEEYVKKIEREWAEAKKELQEARDNARNLTLERENDMKSTLRQVEKLGKELANALRSVAAAESRAVIAEARCVDLEKIVKSAQIKDSEDGVGRPSSTSGDKILVDFREEIEKLRQEAQTSKDHMIQYKSIAEVNEAALKQMESAYESFRVESDKVRGSVEGELQSLRERVAELERECDVKTEEAASANAGKEEALVGALSEIASLKEECSIKMSQIVVIEAQISALKDDLENEHQRWRAAQANYERQVILQSETIQELMKTSQALASTKEETSELRKVTEELKNENSELKAKWETENLSLEASKKEADKRYSEVNELNKILHSQIDALHIKLAEKDKGIASGSTSQTSNEDGLQDVVNYLRRSKEIAETEISLLRQEKLRLQSQLESALKAAESAQASLQAERAKFRASLFTEEEFKSLQLQVRELTLLRESNVQLREETRHNFEECQKLREGAKQVRTEIENLDRLLKDRDKEVEAYKREIEMERTEKDRLEKRIAELMEKLKDDEYDRMRESFEQMQATMREKDVQFEEIKKLVSEKQDAISHLEQDLARCKAELNEKVATMNEIAQAEASLRPELDKFKRVSFQLRRKTENLVKEKDELSKEIKVLSKQLEDAKLGKRNLADAAGEQAMKEKEKEKDTRIQILEKILERLREDLKKEKDDHNKEKDKSQKIRKTIIDSHDLVTQQRTKLEDELEKHRQAVKTLHDEVEKLKNSKGSQSETASVVTFFADAILEDFAAAYLQAVENFERAVLPVCTEREASTSIDPSSMDPLSGGTAVDQAGIASSQNILSPPAPAANIPAMRTFEEKEKRLTFTKTNTKGRRLVRPNITKPKEHQGDVEMSVADETNSSAKHLSSQNMETEGNPTVPTPSVVRKRPSASFYSVSQEELLAPEEPSSDVAAPVLKKSKGTETLKEGGEEQPTAILNVPEAFPASEESSDDVENLHNVMKEEPVDAERDELATAGEEVDELTLDGKNQAELQSDSDVAEENLDNPNEAVVSDEQLRFQTEQDIQRLVTESGAEREEGELVSDIGDTEGIAITSNAVGSPEVGELPPEHAAASESSPAADEIMVSATLEAGEIDTAEVLDEEKNDCGDMIEDTVESSDKANDGTDQIVAETDQVPGAASTAGEEASTNTADAEGKQTSPVTSSSTIISLDARARQRASIRQTGMLASSERARGRTARGRGSGTGTARGSRTWRRGQSSG